MILLCLMVKKKDRRKYNKGLPGIAGAKKKPAGEVKESVSFYVKGAEIAALGGKDRVREIALNAIANELLIQSLNQK